MLNIKKILYVIVATACGSFLLFGCVKKESSSLGERHNVTVQLNVGTRAVSESNETPTPEESALHSLRVYAFVDGRLAGYYFNNGSMEAPAIFLMDLTLYSTTTKDVNFYVVANEAAMETPGSSKRLTKNTTEAELNAFSFTQLNTTYGLPMFCKETQPINFTEDTVVNPQTDSGHEGHTLLKQQLNFSLKRPIAKLGIFAAKAAGESGQLTVTGLTMLASGTRVSNYLMPQERKILEQIGSTRGDIVLAVVESEVSAELNENISPAERSDPSNYTPVLSKAFYPFENPWGSNAWNIIGDEHGNILRINYAFDGEERTGLVYMPPIERNHYYTICCLMHNSGKITVEYTVSDWDEGGTYPLEFAYPNYTNPLQPADGSLPPEGRKYPQPEIYCSPDEDSDEGSYTFRFSITGPIGQEWQPTLLDATPGDFELTVYKNGTEATIPYTADPYPYQIKIKALKPENVGKTVKLAISYIPAWDPSGTSLLMINGKNEDMAWEGSDLSEVIVIKQTDIP